MNSRRMGGMLLMLVCFLDYRKAQMFIPYKGFPGKFAGSDFYDVRPSG